MIYYIYEVAISLIFLLDWQRIKNFKYKFENFCTDFNILCTDFNILCYNIFMKLQGP